MASKQRRPMHYGKEYEDYLKPRSQYNRLVLREAYEAKAREALRENMHSDRFVRDWDYEEDQS